MALEHHLALAEEGRVVRLFGGPANDRAESAREAAAPGDARFRVRDAGWPADLLERLDGSVERRLRDPASNIALSVEALRHQVPERHSDRLKAIVDAAARADGVLLDLLNFVRSGLGPFPVNRRPIDLRVLCERAVDAMHSAHSDRAMIFTSDRRIEGRWDPDAIETLLSKLVLNAIEHGPGRPAIRIAVHATLEGASIEVWNGGTIEDQALRARLFEPFVSSARPGAPMNGQGLGLGLYLAREIARAHGGRIDWRSEEDEGTAFRVTLPRA